VAWVPEEGPGAVLLDANAFVAAIKNLSRETPTYRLLVYLLEREDIRLVGNILLAKEYLRYAEVFPSPTAAALAVALAQRMDVVPVEDRFILACSPYFPAGGGTDCVHAATCLQTGAVLVSNDKDFEPIAKAGLVHRWTVTDAIRRWLPSSRR
jgi:predicted nucleic acid-binding protein